jgi:ABC-type antimicrobial peptide transport system permease subunit
MSETILLVACGTALGVAVSLAVTGYVQPLIYGLGPQDPLAFASAVFVIAAVGLIAAWLPARQASRLDPASVLRDA